MNPDSNLTALARNNRTCMIAHTATAGVMLLLLFLQAATRGINPAVLTISCILGIAPVAAELLTGRKTMRQPPSAISSETALRCFSHSTYTPPQPSWLLYS